ncbi:nitroreductase family protein [Hugenholtzia roseola]|uniref:nitroreductase family protein n=1 Tax=Hugenholtzia roseola TaxID=1002 RepID=UPI00041AB7B9|nr:nitroreductase family protein [Hugenholtzia roseola]
MIKKLTTQTPVLDLIRNRWSPRAFAERDLSQEVVASLIEAAGCAPSAMNEQPWRFVVALRQEEAAFQTLCDLLLEGNKKWAKNAAALVVVLGKQTYSLNGKPNGNAAHDAGMATQNLLLQALSLEVYGHVMEGFEKEKATAVLGLSPDFKPVTMLALGYLGQADSLEEPYYTRETTPRSRKAVEEICFSVGKTIQ